MAQLRCPTCDTPFDSATSRALPFCCSRCRQIDLNRWLTEEQRLPYRDTGDADSHERDDAEDN